jgi:hypothetical protein
MTLHNKNDVEILSFFLNTSIAHDNKNSESQTVINQRL